MNQRLNHISLNNRLRFWRWNDTPPTTASVFFYRVAAFASDGFCLVFRIERTNWLGWILECWIAQTNNRLSYNANSAIVHLINHKGVMKSLLQPKANQPLTHSARIFQWQAWHIWRVNRLFMQHNIANLRTITMNNCYVMTSLD